MNNNPINANDPTGMAVFLGAKPIEPNISGVKIDLHAFHTVLVLIPDNPQDFTNSAGWQSYGNGQIISTLSGQPS